MDIRDPRTLRLWDLADNEAVVVTCTCRSVVQYRRGYLQRRHRLPSDTLIYDLQFKLRCKHCNVTSGFKIEVRDTSYHNIGQEPEPLVIVPS
jgi:hypothetical protein